MRELTVLLGEFALTDPARACAEPAGAYANCLALSARCADWLRERDVACGLLRFTGSREPFPAGAGRWPLCDPSDIRHWTVRAGPWSIDWTARQFDAQAGWPALESVESVAARWQLAEDWACERCPELVADARHRDLAPVRLERAHRELARATGGRGPFDDPRHDGGAGLAALCACATAPVPAPL